MCGILAYTGTDSLIKKKLRLEFCKTSYRGPDKTIIKETDDGFFGFHRLRIIDTTEAGDQPFVYKDNYAICNGEIFNYQELKKEFADFPFHSQSDCEVLTPLFLASDDYIAQAQKLDGEFAFVVKSNGKWIAGRDPMGIRPLFYGKDDDGAICFSSEAKVLINFCKEIIPFPPGHIMVDGQLSCFHDHAAVEENKDLTEEKSMELIHDLFVKGVEKRMHADVPVGFLLSGGLDSSLVCSVANKFSDKPLRTFAIGIEDGPIDTKYARIVADYLGTDHTEVLFTKDDIFNSLKELIFLLETWDITTIRAAMGMYLLTKYIEEKTDIKVVMTGEVSDEMFGYKYTDFAPSPEEFQREAQRRVRELYYYDVLRADRCIAGASLEARVPFSDKYFVDAVMSIPAELKMNTKKMGKYILRKSFDNGEYLPEEILWREKAAFSDAVGHSMVDYLKEFAEEFYGDDWQEIAEKHSHGTPFTKESLLYREIFEEYLPGRAKLIPDFWMPNQSWEGCNVKDPSARALGNYGKSGE